MRLAPDHRKPQKKHYSANVIRFPCTLPFPNTMVSIVNSSGVGGVPISHNYPLCHLAGDGRPVARQSVIWITAWTITLVYAKGPLTRWVERVFLGYRESAEEDEERIGNAIRALTRLDEFGARFQRFS
jgi:hypothetical protein